MRHVRILLSIILSLSFFACKGQKNFGSGQLTLKRSIPLNVSGRIDHIDVNLKQQVIYVASLGNNSLEVVDLNEGKVIG
ncbi:MAG TPA: hypothetical protein VL095_10375 [Flavisolibacter sp.]|nr:hypothetical protein [Flavisolibacter sp.]